MTLKFGPISYNTRTHKVNFDRRTIKGAPVSVHVGYILAGAVATVAVAKLIDTITE